MYSENILQVLLKAPSGKISHFQATHLHHLLVNESNAIRVWARFAKQGTLV